MATAGLVMESHMCVVMDSDAKVHRFLHAI